MKFERKVVGFEIKEVDEEEGIFEGYAATFSKHPDSYGDIIDKGAFKKTIKESGNRVKILWNHNTYEPIGIPIEMSEDDTGLKIKGKLSLGVQRAREILSLMKDGVITEMSIGYNAIKTEMDKDIRHLTEIRLWDTSPVTFAANPEALITGVKEDGDIPPLDTLFTSIEGIESEAKADRVLSAANRGKVRSAIAALQALLASSLDDDDDDEDGRGEPDKSTPDPISVVEDDDPEAAELEAAVAELRSVGDGFDMKEAEDRIDNLLKVLQESGSKGD